MTLSTIPGSVALIWGWCYTRGVHKRVIKVIKDTKVFEQRLGALLGYYKRNISEQVIEWWFEAVDDSLNDEQFERACFQCIRTQRYLPAIAEFIELVTPSQESIQSYEDNQVWQGIVHHLGSMHPASAGQYKKARKRFISNLLPECQYALERLGGLSVLAQVSSDDLHWREKDFQTYIKAYRVQQQAGNVPPSQPALQSESVQCLPESQSAEVEFASTQAVSIAQGSREGFSRLGDLI